MVSLGIDFGTTNTVAAVCSGDRCDLIALPGGREVTPSVVRFPPGGGVTVGSVALRSRPVDPMNTVYSIKRVLGRPWHSREVLEYRNQYPFAVESDAADKLRITTRAGKLTPVEIAAHVFRFVSESSVIASASIDTVAITVPVAAREDQRAATVAAAAQAGFANLYLIDEPRASALAYLHDEITTKTIAVYDLGGGTFDLGILRWEGGAFKSLASGGDTYLGGDDVTYRCINWAADQILQEHHWDVRANIDGMAALSVACENAKIALSKSHQIDIDLSDIDPNLAGRSLTLERVVLEKISDDLVRRTFILCDEVIARSSVSARDVDMIVLAGGGSYMPCIRQGVERYFGSRPKMEIAPDRVVAVGAARHAAHIAAD